VSISKAFTASIIAAGLLLVAEAPAMAMSMTGNELLSACEAQGDAQQGVCAGFSNGTADGLAVGMYFAKACWFKVRTGADTRQVVAVTVKYLRDHPEDRDQAAATLTLLALRQAFPC
jgi:hypothetical protein